MRKAKVTTIPDQQFSEIVADSLSFNEAAKRSFNTGSEAAIRKTKDLIEQLGLSTAHFGPRRKYKAVTKVCPVCGVEFETKDGGRESKVCCGHQCANTLAAKNRDQVELNRKIKAGLDEMAANKRATGEFNQKVEIECARCSKVFEVSFSRRNRRFCSQKCSWAANRKPEPATTNEPKTRKPRPLEYERKTEIRSCEECGAEFEIEIGPPSWKKRRFCSRSCIGKVIGRKSAAARVLRSKNEAHFATLCGEIFEEVAYNEPVFNGWDADVILKKENVAVLWNGAWHYKEGLGRNHSLLQVQTRDKIKMAEIEKAGFKPYVIKDMGRENPEFVVQEFEKFKKIMGR